MTNPRNSLSQAASAYLRQHADNPVHWQQWGEPALAMAKDLNRPILLSIGYSACHWCHVMAHESFEDENTAAIMNALFVNIKVDREERPDIDQIYMAALTAMGDQGGWPLTMFLTPDGRPFWGGTYFPPASGHGRPSFTDVLYGIDRLWREDRQKVGHNRDIIFNHISARLAQTTDSSNAIDSHHALNEYALRIYSLVDHRFGGLRGAPKFPSAPMMESLWLSWLDTGNIGHRDAFVQTLSGMLSGGIYDHLGGGLCRYSVDEQWLIPHFEKMLYDNAQLIRHATWAYAETANPLFRLRIEETVDWLRREMLLANGSFASSLDADSEGDEGRYYVWSESEVDEILGPDADAFKKLYNVTASGNWNDHVVGQNVINRISTPSVIIDDAMIDSAKRKLFLARSARIAPARDDKVLTDWNAILIRSLVDAGRLLGRNDWIEMAVRCYLCVSGSIVGSRPAHCVMDTVRIYPALSGDYAALINAAISLHAIFPDQNYLADALALERALNHWHRDENNDYRLSAHDANDVIIRIYGDIDEATPSATSQIIEACTRLSVLVDDPDMHDQLRVFTRQALSRTMKQPYGQAGILNSARISADSWTLVIIVDTFEHELVKQANGNPDPRRTDKIILMSQADDITLSGFGKLKTDMPAAWLCKGNICLAPVHTASALKAILKRH